MVQLYLEKKTESLEHFQADLVELALRADCAAREDEKVKDTFTAQLHSHKIAEDLIDETQSAQDASEYPPRQMNYS